MVVGLVAVVCFLIYLLRKGFPSSSYFPKWVSIWLCITTIIVLWDASFVLNRPASFTNVIWYPYRDYVQVDKIYGDMEDPFVVAQSYMNLVEVTLNVISLILLRRRKFKQAAVIALVASVMTCSKTIIYHVMEVVSGYKYSKHNDRQTFIMLYLLPNGVWIWVPMYASFVLGKGLARDSTKHRK